MPNAESTLYSQGVNFGSFVQEGVDARTGQYTSSIALYEAPAKARNCAPFKLSLRFSPLNTANIGFGKGWSLNLSQYQHSAPRSLVLSTGEHYKVSNTGGLRVDDQKLKSFIFQQKGSDFEIIHKDGKIEVLSNAHNVYNTSVPVKLYAANGRALTLVWMAVSGQPRLTKVQDGDEVLLQIKYRDPHVEVIHSPDSASPSTFTAVIRESQLQEFWLPLTDSSRWRFTYNTYGPLICLSNIHSPLGLVEEVTYDSSGLLLPPGGPYKSLPVVRQHIIKPGNQQPAIKTLYDYSTNNFLGYGAVSQWKYSEDNLYHVSDSYQYYTTVSVNGGQKTKYTYNRFHLIVETKQDQNGKQITQTIDYYAIPNRALENQPAQFQLPKCVKTTYCDLATPSLSRVESTSHEYDEWGNPTLDIQTDGVTTKRTYYPPNGETGKCPADPHGFQRYLKEQTIIPPDKQGHAPTWTTSHTYSEMPTAKDAPAPSFVLLQQSQSFADNDPCNCKIDKTYVSQSDGRDHGRYKQQTSTLYEKYPMVQTWNYQYEGGQLSETTQLKSFDDLQINNKTNFSLADGWIMSHVDEAGVETQFKYDQVGRQISTTVSPGTVYEATQTHEYVLSGETAGYTVTVTDAKGLKTRSTTDGLQRVCQIERQDDDGESKLGAYTGTFRIVQEKNYNALGQCTRMTDIDWLRASEEPKKQSAIHDYEYNDWGQVCKVTDSNGVVTLAASDPITQTYTEGIKDEGQKKATFESQDHLIQTALLNAHGSMYSSVNYTNDGLGRKVQEKDSLDNNTQYIYDCFNRVKKTTWPDGRMARTQYAGHSTDPLPESIQVSDITLGQQPFDGLSRAKSQQVANRQTLLSYENSSPKPSDITTPRKDKVHLDYEKALNYALKDLRTSDDPCSYHYDPQTAEVWKSENTYCTEELKYLPSGLLKSERITIGKETKTQFSTKYSYSMNGRLQGYTDVHGKDQVLDYDDYGRLKQLSQGPLAITLSYDNGNRLAQSIVHDKQKDKKLTTVLKYDEFGREIERTISRDSKIMYVLNQKKYDTENRVKSRELRDGSGNVIRQETFQYDSMGRLFDYVAQGNGISIDEHGRQVLHQQYLFTEVGGLKQVTSYFQDGSQNITDYTYSDHDPCQLILITNTHPDDNPKIELEYDSNGCLTRDEQGRIIEYDTSGTLKTVRNKDQTVLCQYYYDSHGRLLTQEVPGKSDHHLHYRGDTIVAATSGDTKISYVSSGDQHWGQILQESEQTTTQLWASDIHQSTIAWLDTDKPSEIHSQVYMPYGFSRHQSAVGWNGQWQDPVTGWYHLGNGYRVYNPVLMRFHSPDSWSPFTSGDINTYAYCCGDPINRIDPSGHFSIFGIQITWRNLAQAIVGLALSVLAGILTDGASLAIEVGVDLAVAVASDVGTGAVYDVAAGRVPNMQSVGSDVLFGGVGNMVGRGLSWGAKRAFKSVTETLEQLLVGAEKLRVAGGKPVMPSQMGTIRSFKRFKLQAEQFSEFNSWNKMSAADKKLFNKGLADMKAKIDQIESRESWTWVQAKDLPNVGGKNGAASQKLIDFRRLVREERLSPVEAAKRAGDTKLTLLKGSNPPQWEIRTSGSDRVTFRIDHESRKITIQQVGGHT
ncbi:34f6a79c-e88d-466b-bef5-8af45c46dfa9 [Sclerotinia trifoliorum]|uniref:34f6a79c-e88d-466b-bef5-8af45c46dfa9 n=1 Tax=Sclerotinia trifoliorum TaxID=28548 RepID=A0A8H2ZME3_9HELO|nr:34f6a79c-e88d-466b-bef5-8af45c46dfa9 [Sclerotinia trifoliorum]